MAFKMNGWSAFKNDGKDEEPNFFQRIRGKIQRNKYNKEALRNKPLSEERIEFLNKKINDSNTSKSSARELKKLLKLNEKGHRRFLKEQRESKVRKRDTK